MQESLPAGLPSPQVLPLEEVTLTQSGPLGLPHPASRATPTGPTDRPQSGRSCRLLPPPSHLRLPMHEAAAREPTCFCPSLAPSALTWSSRPAGHPHPPSVPCTGQTDHQPAHVASQMRMALPGPGKWVLCQAAGGYKAGRGGLLNLPGVLSPSWGQGAPEVRHAHCGLPRVVGGQTPLGSSLRGSRSDIYLMLNLLNIYFFHFSYCTFQLQNFCCSF